jgi:hypothetical protein
MSAPIKQVTSPAVCLTAPRAREDAGGYRRPGGNRPFILSVTRKIALRIPFRDKSVLRSLTRASGQSPIATAVRAVSIDMAPGKYANT